MEWIFQIKEAKSYDRQVLTQAIVDLPSKQDVINYIEKTYPEYFDGNKVAQKLTKKSEQCVYVSIYELDNYWSSYWKAELECKVCHKKVPLIEIKNMHGHVGIHDFICCPECEAKRQELVEADDNEYWDSRCEYYYIYKITNKANNKVYIGYTAREPIFRWWEHFKHSSYPIGKALTEHGIENFTFEVLEKHNKESKTIPEMHEIETRYMQEFNSIEDGYNCVQSAHTEVTTKPLFSID